MDEVKFKTLLIGCLFPFIILKRKGYRNLSHWLLTLYIACCVVFLVGIGYMIAHIAFTIAMTVHIVLSISVLRDYNHSEFFLHRLKFVLKILVCILALYWGGNTVLQYLIQAVHYQHKTYVAGSLGSHRHYKTGDWILFRIDTVRFGDAHVAGGAFIIFQGFQLGQILALQGDVVTFRESEFTVNGRSHPRMPDMPTSGEFTVPNGTYFVWADYNISSRGIPSSAILNMLQHLGMVEYDHVEGKVFKNWFFRKQLD
jgi:type IV secretory pathway VirB3-like protein